MEFKQFYLACLAHASYVVGDDGECAIVDPQRDVQQYIDEAEARGLRIRHVIETHLHADFVSGHLELARRTGATIHIGAQAKAAFDHHAVHDGDEIVMGDVTLRFLETPGHTPESLCVLVFDRSVGEQPLSILTGDTLFIGDVGRPDLAGSKGYTSEQMAGLMYDTLRNKIMGLPDAVEVFPAHGAGSACGRNISSALSCTVGRQKEMNHALQPMDRDDFIRGMTTGLLPAPQYFPKSAELNRQGAPGLDDLPEVTTLSPGEVDAAVGDGALVLDVRDAAAFGDGHLPGSLNVGLGGMFASWCGTLIPIGRPMIVVTETPAQVQEASLRLARVGHHGLMGSLVVGVDAWRADGRELVLTEQVTVEELASRRESPASPVVLDVRKPGEYADGHVPGAVPVPLELLEQRLDALGLDPLAPTAVICATGYRSSAGCSLLERHGFRKVANVTGGTTAWIDAGFLADPEPATVG